MRRCPGPRPNAGLKGACRRLGRPLRRRPRTARTLSRTRLTAGRPRCPHPRSSPTRETTAA
eukprot:5634732-Alexandrium_andersonii.AAC.1